MLAIKYDNVSTRNCLQSVFCSFPISFVISRVRLINLKSKPFATLFKYSCNCYILCFLLYRSLSFSDINLFYATCISYFATMWLFCCFLLCYYTARSSSFSYASISGVLFFSWNLFCYFISVYYKNEIDRTSWSDSPQPKCSIVTTENYIKGWCSRAICRTFCLSVLAKFWRLPIVSSLIWDHLTFTVYCASGLGNYATVS